MNPFNQPLKEVRILDLSRLIAGPMATTILGDLGAEVVKVEPPNGDEGRRYGRLLAGGNSGLFVTYNRNKKSIVIDLQKPAGRDLVMQLIRRCDVLVQNFRPGVMKRLGLDYEVAQQQNPGIIYCSISGYGQTGPHSQLPAYEAILQAAGGLMSVTGEEGGKPTRVGASIGDFTAGVFAALSIITALYARRDDGKSRYLDISLLEGQLALMNSFIVEYLLSGVVPVAWGTASQYQAPSGVFPTATEDLMIMVGEAHWQKFCAVIGAEQLACDPRFASMPQRIANRKALEAAIHPQLREKTAEEWLALLREYGIPCSPVNRVDQVVRDQQVIARRAVGEVTHPSYGSVPQVGPVAWRLWPAEQDPPMQPPPMPGEHTAAVLRDFLGLSDEEIGGLEHEGIVYCLRQ